MEQNDTRNLILAMVLSMAIFLTWSVFFGPKPEDAPIGDAQAQSEVVEDVEAPVTRDEALATSERITIETPRIGGTIALTGGVIDDLGLHDYQETLDANSPDVNVLRPKGSDEEYYAQTGFTAGEGTDEANVPTNSEVWSLKSGTTLAPNAPVVLSWTSATGVEYEREFAVDENYMFTVTERILNNSGKSITINPVTLITHRGTPFSNGTFVLHEGAIRNVDGVIQEATFKDLRNGSVSAANPSIHIDSESVENNGWIGLTTKYWMTVIAPLEGTLAHQTTHYYENSETYKLGAHLRPVTIAAGANETVTTRIYAGAKEVDLIREYRDTLGIDRFDDTVDWGWFYFLTKPFFSLLHWLYGIFGNMGLAIIAMTFVIKAVLFPLANKSYASMAKMKKLQPQMEALKEAAGDDRAKLQQGMMELYRKEKVNPVSGCLPLFLQIPIFFALYKVLYVTTELRHAPFFGPWRDLSAPDPTSIMNLFGLLPWSAPETGSFLALIFLGILPILLGISMYLTQKLNPTPQDPTQKMIFAWMPWVFMFMMAGFATGLIIYWITNNVLTFIQQYTIMRMQGVKVDLVGNILGRNKA